jgi:hypothetical protein
VKTKNEQGSRPAYGPEGRSQWKSAGRARPKVIAEGFDALIGDLVKKGLFLNLIRALHDVLEFEDAFILQMQDNQRMLAFVSTSDKLQGTVWEPDTVFKRVLSGRPMASSNVNLVSEWAGQPATVRENIGSALHINLGGGRLAILVVTHSIPGYLSLIHI